MYKKIQNRQAELTDFNKPSGFKINPLNRWGIKASTIPWDAIEERVYIHVSELYRTGCKAFENGAGVSPDTEEIRPF